MDPNPLHYQLNASEVCALGKCVASTLRAWRNRNGLFAGRRDYEDAWIIYDLADALGVRLVVLLTENGQTAQASVDLVNEMRQKLVYALAGASFWVAVSRRKDGSLRFDEVAYGASVMDGLAAFSASPLVTLINLHQIRNELFREFADARGLT